MGRNNSEVTAFWQYGWLVDREGYNKCGNGVTEGTIRENLAKNHGFARFFLIVPATNRPDSGILRVGVSEKLTLSTTIFSSTFVNRAVIPMPYSVFF
jgi:hypothetical protein